jgi:hypothetical protein
VQLLTCTATTLLALIWFLHTNRLFLKPPTNPKLIPGTHSLTHLLTHSPPTDSLSPLHPTPLKPGHAAPAAAAPCRSVCFTRARIGCNKLQHKGLGLKVTSSMSSHSCFTVACIRIHKSLNRNLKPKTQTLLSANMSRQQLQQ